MTKGNTSVCRQAAVHFNTATIAFLVYTLKVEDQLKQTRASLAKLPPAIVAKDRADVLQQALRALGRDAEQLVKAQGSLSSKHFAQRWRVITEDLAR